MKFKSGDFVEVLPGGRYSGDIRAGLMGHIIQHYPHVQNSTHRADNVYHIKFADFEGYVVEHCLKLVPGNPDVQKTGSWDECPWSPYRIQTKEPS